MITIKNCIKHKYSRFNKYHERSLKLSTDVTLQTNFKEINKKIGEFAIDENTNWNLEIQIGDGSPIIIDPSDFTQFEPTFSTISPHDRIIMKIERSP